MRKLLTGVVLLTAVAWVLVAAADRQWQTGRWADVSVKREVVDFGPGAAPLGMGAPTSSARRAMADVCTYAIETQTDRYELKEVVAMGRCSFDALSLGQPVTFAVEKRAVYVRGADSKEHKIPLTKTIKLSK